jgi:hypothetical protein
MEAQVSNQSMRDQLLKKLEHDGEAFFSRGVWNNITDLSLTIATVLASLVATALAASDPRNVSRWLIATIAAVPAAAASIQKTVGVRERSNWYFMYAAQVRCLATKLEFADAPNVEEIAQKRAILELEMEAKWSEIGHSVAALTGRREKVNPHE